ncbi:hypothetical protein SADUNF_Sadunf16G0111600 [Salix dunnii]|uniref:Uncharacterized protein n=1 Tax=Salix dunnii TaxID=1413687 RepID=A0A835MGN3_9ROSI|nr:hypothetical protein SADUNF_Sadunf16G0111600 [Salix dunnii]
MQSLKQSATNPPLLENPCISHLLLLFIAPSASIMLNQSLKPMTLFSQFHHILSFLDHLEKAENFESPESIFYYLIEVYGVTDKTQEAIELFCRIPKFRCVPSVYSLDTLMPVLCRSSKGLKLVPESLLNSPVMNTRMEESTFQVLLQPSVGLERMSPGARDWKVLLLYSGTKLGFIEITLFSLVDTVQTQLSSENVAVDEMVERLKFTTAYISL